MDWLSRRRAQDLTDGRHAVGGNELQVSSSRQLLELLEAAVSAFGVLVTAAGKASVRKCCLRSSFE